jgi:hypothetical protein
MINIAQTFKQQCEIWCLHRGYSEDCLLLFCNIM